MKIGILGAGSIGMHLAAQLHLAGQDVTLICRTQQQAVLLLEEGLVYEDYEGNKKQLNIPVVSEEGVNIAFDILMIALKQTHLQSALTTLSRLLAVSPVVVCFQNGIGHAEFFDRHFPHVSLFLAVTTEGALRESINSVRHTGIGTTWIGSADGENNYALVESILQQIMHSFIGTKITVKADLKIHQRIWKKVLVNACINPLTAIFRVRNGKLIESASLLSIMEMIYLEAKEVAMSEGIEIEQGFLQEIVAVCKSTCNNKSSMLQDVEAGRKTEIDYINGAIKRTAEQHGITVPYNSMVLEMIHAIQALGTEG
jgi:2-dehydropantoate 2-reductase